MVAAPKYLVAGRTLPEGTLVEARPKDGVKGGVVRGFLRVPFNDFDITVVIGKGPHSHHLHADDYTIVPVELRS